LDEYGVPLHQAEAAETEAMAEIDVVRKAGRLVPFTGKL
jgi:hypothetical protein